MEVGLQALSNEMVVVPAYVEYNGLRVLTTEQLAMFYGCSVDNIWDNFRKNSNRFIEGKHYFKLTGDSLKAFREQQENFRLQISPMTRSLILWTKRGAARHAKMLTTDRAWEVYEELEDNYFDAKIQPNAALESIIRQVIKDFTMTPEQKQRFESLIPLIALQLQALIVQKIAYCKNHEVTDEDLAVLDLPGEIWRWLSDFEGLYQVSTAERIRSFYRGKVRILKPKINDNGYYEVGLYKDGKTYCRVLNQLVAKAFIPNPENKPEVDHIDNNPLNNKVENLRWATRKENAQYAAETGRYKRGENNPNSKLTSKQAKEIYDSYKPRSKEFGIKALAKKYGVSRSTIEHIVYGEIWIHATEALPANAEISLIQ